MKQKGVRVDLEKADKIKKDLQKKKMIFFDPLKSLLTLTSKFGLLPALQKRSRSLIWTLILHQRGSQSLTKTFLLLTKARWPKWLLNVERLIKREPRSSIRSSSIRTEGGFMLRYTKCDPTKEER
jgi:hypothetical protein